MKLVYVPQFEMTQEIEFPSLKELVNYLETDFEQMNLAYVCGIGNTTFIDNNFNNIITFIECFAITNTIYLLEFNTLKEAYTDHIQYLTENNLL